MQRSKRKVLGKNTKSFAIPSAIHSELAAPARLFFALFFGVGLICRTKFEQLQLQTLSRPEQDVFEQDLSWSSTNPI